MLSHNLLSSLQNTIDCLSRAREESKAQSNASIDSGRSTDPDFNDRLTNVERSLLHVIARLDKAEESILNSKLRPSPNVEEVLSASERLLRELFLEMIKQQNLIERYRQENEALKEKLFARAPSGGVNAPSHNAGGVNAPSHNATSHVGFGHSASRNVPSSNKPNTFSTFSSSTAAVGANSLSSGMNAASASTHSPLLSSASPSASPSTSPSSFPSSSSSPFPSTSSSPSPFPSPSVNSNNKGLHKRPSTAPKAAPPPKQTVTTRGRARASSFGEDDFEIDGANTDDTDGVDPPTVTLTPATTLSHKTLHVDFPPGYNPNRGRRFSVAGESLNPTSDMSSGPRTIIRKSEEAKRRIRSVIMNNILFKNLDEDQLEDLVDEMFEVRLRPDEVIIRQGDDGDNFYVVDSGELYVLYRDVVVATIGSGKSFGEIALMYNCPRTATVRAKTDCILWGMSRGTFRRSLMVYAIRKRELYESFLARVPLLETLLPYERSTIADALEPRTYNNGDILIRQGEKGDLFFILERGKVVVTKGEVEVKVYGEGDYFGELALLNDQPRAATVRSVGVTRVLTLSREDFANLMGPCEEILKRNMILYQQVQDGEPAPTSPSTSKPRDLSALVQEFVSEEAIYLRNLQILVAEFLIPLRKASESNGLPIHTEEVASLFANVEMLLNIHATFAADAARLPSMTATEITKVFSKLYPGLKFYNEYIKNWPTASDIFAKYKNADKIVQFLKAPTRAPHDLYSLLRAPVDRIPKMVAFLKDVQVAANDKDLADVVTKLSTIGQ